MTLRVAVVAAGSHIFQAAHIPAIEGIDATVIAIHDAMPERAAAVGGAHGWPTASDLYALLELRPGVVVVCAPHPLHRDIVLEALATGSAVIVEKPVAARLSEIDEIIAASDASGVPVAVVHQHRLRTEVVEARRLLDEGALGRIHRVVVEASYPKRSVYYSDTPWRGTWRGEGGGVLLNQGLHDIDLLVHLLGAPRRVVATLRTLVHPIQAEDVADVMLEWADGATGSIHITSAAALGENRIEIHGTSGALRLTADGLWARSASRDFDAFAAEAGGHFDPFPLPAWRLAVPAGAGTHGDVYRDLAAALDAGREPAVSVRDARGAVEIIAAAELGSHEARWVDLPLPAAEYDEFLDAMIAQSEAAA